MRHPVFRPALIALILASGPAMGDSPLARLAQLTQPGTATAQTEAQACAAAARSAEAACLAIGRSATRADACRCAPSAGLVTCQTTTECVPKF